METMAFSMTLAGLYVQFPKSDALTCLSNTLEKSYIHAPPSRRSRVSVYDETLCVGDAIAHKNTNVMEMACCYIYGESTHTRTYAHSHFCSTL